MYLPGFRTRSLSGVTGVACEVMILVFSGIRNKELPRRLPSLLLRIHDRLFCGSNRLSSNTIGWYVRFSTCGYLSRSNPKDIQYGHCWIHPRHLTMPAIISLLLLCAHASHIFANSTYTNPILQGFHPDPSCVFVPAWNNTFFCVSSSFLAFPGLPIHSSQDLKSWTLISNALHRPEQLPGLADVNAQTGGIWAPTIRFHDDTFYITTTLVYDSRATNDSSRWDVHRTHGDRCAIAIHHWAIRIVPGKPHLVERQYDRVFPGSWACGFVPRWVGEMVGSRARHAVDHRAVGCSDGKGDVAVSSNLERGIVAGFGARKRYYEWVGTACVE